MADKRSIERAFVRLGEARGLNSQLGRGRANIKERLFGAKARLSLAPEPAPAARRHNDKSTRRKAEATTMEATTPRGGGRHPERIGRFMVIECLGEGGMGKVYRTYDAGPLEREVAVKVMHPKVAKRHGRRLLREAQALARLSHANVVHVYEVGECDEQLFIAMELVRGQTLEQWQRQEPRPDWKACLQTYLQAGRGLAAAHAAGLIHRDFKPGNCIIDDEDGRVRVLDFGLARDASPSGSSVEPGAGVSKRKIVSADPDPSASSSALMEPLTETGSVLGTKAYMAPEQLTGRSVDAKSDQFAFCVSLYEALCGERPFTNNPVQVLWEMTTGIDHRPTPLPASAKVPRWLQRAIFRGLASDPDDRWPSMVALMRELERHQRGVGVRRASLMGGGVLVLGVAGWFGSGSNDSMAPAEPPCRDSQTQIEHSWNEDARTKVRTAILGTEVSYAEKTWKTVEGRLDRYAADWVERDTAVCKAVQAQAEPPPPELVEKRRCLRLRRRALGHHVELLAGADEQLVEQAVDLVTTLPSVDSCEDEAALARRAAESRTAQELEAIEDLREQLDRIRSYETLGRHAIAVADLRARIPAIRALEDEALLAESLVVGGRLYMSLGDDERAEAYFGKAQQMAVEHRIDSTAVEVMANRIHLVGVEREHTQLALALGTDTALPMARRDEFDRTRLARVLTVMAQVHTVRGDLREAEHGYREALEILREARGEFDISRVEALDGLAQVLSNQGELREAERLYREALTIRTSILGEDHPETAYQRTNLGMLLVQQGKLDEGRRHCGRALQTLESASAPNAKRIAHARASFGLVLSQQGEYGEAETHLREALRQWEQQLDPDQLRVAMVRNNLAAVLRKQGRREDAVVEYREALAHIQRNEATPARETLWVNTLGSLALVLVEQGRVDDAMTRYEQAFEIFERVEGERDVATVSIFNRYGDLLLGQGDDEGAERMYLRALDHYEGQLGPRHVRVGHTLKRLARVSMGRGEWAEAQSLLERTRTIYEAAGLIVMPEQLAKVEELLTEVRAHVQPPR